MLTSGLGNGVWGGRVNVRAPGKLGVRSKMKGVADNMEKELAVVDDMFWYTGKIIAVLIWEWLWILPMNLICKFFSLKK